MNNAEYDSPLPPKLSTIIEVEQLTHWISENWDWRAKKVNQYLFHILFFKILLFIVLVR